MMGCAMLSQRQFRAIHHGLPARHLLGVSLALSTELRQGRWGQPIDFRKEPCPIRFVFGNPSASGALDRDRGGKTLGMRCDRFPMEPRLHYDAGKAFVLAGLNKGAALAKQLLFFFVGNEAEIDS